MPPISRPTTTTTKMGEVAVAGKQESAKELGVAGEAAATGEPKVGEERQDSEAEGTLPAGQLDLLS